MARGTIAAVYTLQTVGATPGADHVSGIVKKISGTSQETSVVALSHVESRTASVAGRVKAVPAGAASNMAERAVHRHIVVKIAIFAYAFISSFYLSLSIYVTEFAISLFVPVANCTRIVAGFTMTIFSQTIMAVNARTVGVYFVCVIFRGIDSSVPCGVAGHASRGI